MIQNLEKKMNKPEITSNKSYIIVKDEDQCRSFRKKDSLRLVVRENTSAKKVSDVPFEFVLYMREPKLIAYIIYQGTQDDCTEVFDDFMDHFAYSPFLGE